MDSPSNLALWIQPVIFIAGGLILGFALEIFVSQKLIKMAEKSKWDGDEVIIRALKWMPLLFITLAGIYAAIYTMPYEISSRYYELIRKAYVVIMIFLFTVVASRLVSDFVMLYSKRVEGVLASLTLFVNLGRLFIYMIGGLIIIQYLGISITPILTALGVGGLAVALALQDTLSNLFSGIQILASKQVSPGDYIKLETGDEGYVTDISWRNTQIKTLQNNLINIPNSKLANTIITNYNHGEAELSFFIKVGVHYNSDLEKVESVIMDVAREVMRDMDGGVPDFEPRVRFNTFNDSSIDCNVILRADEFVNQYFIRHEFIKRLHARFNKEGIVIPFPIRTVHLQNK